MKFHLRPKTKIDIHFRPKDENDRKSPDNISVFFIHSVTKWALQCDANISSSFAIFAGGPCWRDSTLLIPASAKNLCGIFLDDISTREQFAFLVYCYRVKAIFHNLRTVLYCHLCGVTNSPHGPLLNTLSTEADVHGEQKVLSSNGFWMANCFCCLSQNAMVCLAHCRQELQQKTWKTARLFLQDRDQDQDQMFKKKTKTSWSKTKTFIFVLESTRDQDPGLEDYITGIYCKAFVFTAFVQISRYDECAATVNCID